MLDYSAPLQAKGGGFHPRFKEYIGAGNLPINIKLLNRWWEQYILHEAYNFIE